MYSSTQKLKKHPIDMPWYKVPILWLMLGLLGSTVIAGVMMFIMAHNTKDSIVTNENFTPLSKKLALPDKVNPNKLPNNKAND